MSLRFCNHEAAVLMLCGLLPKVALNVSFRDIEKALIIMLHCQTMFRRGSTSSLNFSKRQGVRGTKIYNFYQLNKFAIQLDESTDVASCAQLLLFVRYCSEGEIVEDFFYCKSLEQRTTSEAIFDTVSNVFMESLGTSSQKH
jgi:hypothetical protein